VDSRADEVYGIVNVSRFGLRAVIGVEPGDESFITARKEMLGESGIWESNKESD
jgi:hypothetical protein